MAGLAEHKGETQQNLQYEEAMVQLTQNAKR